MSKQCHLDDCAVTLHLTQPCSAQGASQQCTGFWDKYKCDISILGLGTLPQGSSDGVNNPKLFMRIKWLFASSYSQLFATQLNNELLLKKRAITVCIVNYVILWLCPYIKKMNRRYHRTPFDFIQVFCYVFFFSISYWYEPLLLLDILEIPLTLRLQMRLLNVISCLTVKRIWLKRKKERK